MGGMMAECGVAIQRWRGDAAKLPMGAVTMVHQHVDEREVLTLNQPPQPYWLVVYDFANDDEGIALMQETSLSDGDMGLANDPLVGSDIWWQMIRAQQLESVTVQGTIDDVYWGSMGDWPEFSMSAQGARSTWTREGDLRRYVESLAVELTYVEHPRKTGPDAAKALGMTEAATVVLRILIQNSPLRSSGIAPGPGGVGYQLARRHGDVVHYLKFPSDEAARRAELILAERGVTTRSSGNRPTGGWLVQAWHRDERSAAQHRADLDALAEGEGGTYDGGEIVGGAVWGPEFLGS
jgi:hypothetical protein